MESPTRKVVVITGASAGVGRATVREFARQGASIGLIARGADRLEAARREVEELGGKALVLPLDVADADAVEAAAERVERELGPIDAWINVAMVSVFSPVKKMTAAEFKRVTEVTYLGYVNGTLAALRRMLPLVPPIFQPEVPARAIEWITRHPRRKELWLGFPTAKAILGEKFASNFADHYLARVGYRSQQTGEPKPADQPDNLYDPPPDDTGAHGRFDHRARPGSCEFWLRRNRTPLMLAFGGLAGLAATRWLGGPTLDFQRRGSAPRRRSIGERSDVAVI